MPLLDVNGLSVTYATRRTPPATAVRDVSFAIEPGECVGLLGESGSGKSTLGNALLRLLEPPAAITAGRIVFDGTDITGLGDDALRPLRWRRMSTVFQSSMNALNPVMTVEAQFRDVLRTHTELTDDQIWRRTGELLELVLLEPDHMRFHPHELSGGMKQRVALALALALDPDFVLLDEPTTGLDVVVQRSILDNLRALQRERGFAVLMISHDLGSVLEVTDRVMVMYAGRIVEQQSSAAVLRSPLHPYTRGLLGSYADPRAERVDVAYIPGRPPNLALDLPGCPFADRCPEVLDVCRTETPATVTAAGATTACHVVERDRAAGAPATRAGFGASTFTRHPAADPAAAEPVLTVEDVTRTYTRRHGRVRTRVEAVGGVSFALRRGTVTALVGQSGSGKSTLARLVTGVERPDSGTVTFTPGTAADGPGAGPGAAADGPGSAPAPGAVRVDRLGGRALRRYRKHVQLVFQDPFSSLNPTRTVRQALVRPLRNHLGMTERAARERAAELLETVGLAPGHLDRFPHQLSGGQRQRVVIARALAPEPDVLVADEPISMLDVSIRAEILELLDRLIRDRGLALLYITHDLLSARLLADEVLVLNRGRVVEAGPVLDVIRDSRDDYTRLLLDAIPNPFAGAAR